MAGLCLWQDSFQDMFRKFPDAPPDSRAEMLLLLEQYLYVQTKAGSGATNLFVVRAADLFNLLQNHTTTCAGVFRIVLRVLFICLTHVLVFPPTNTPLCLPNSLDVPLEDTDIDGQYWLRCCNFALERRTQLGRELFPSLTEWVSSETKLPLDSVFSLHLVSARYISNPQGDSKYFDAWKRGASELLNDTAGELPWTAFYTIAACIVRFSNGASMPYNEFFSLLEQDSEEDSGVAIMTADDAKKYRYARTSLQALLYRACVSSGILRA